jgi:two-component system, cell cycle sensor histidine kinase and response regulator CckA
MKASKAPVGFSARVQNQLSPLLMRAWFKTRSIAEELAASPQSARENAGVAPPAFVGSQPWLALVGIAVAVLAVAAMSSHVSQGLSLAVLSGLAACGLFFLLTLAFGRLQFAGPSTAQPRDQVADSFPDAVMVATKLGHAIYCNPMFGQLVGRAKCEGLAALEATFLGYPQASAALFRLVRAGERGECSSEDVDVASGRGTAKTPKTLRISVSPVPAGRLNVGPLVVWRVLDITDERVRDRQQAQVFEQRLSAYEHAPVGILISRADGSITHINPMLQRWLQCSIGDDRWNLIQMVFAPLIQAASGDAGAQAGYACDIPVRSGRPVPLLLTAVTNTSTLDDDVGSQDRAFLVMRRSRDTAELTATISAADSVAHLYETAPFGIASVSATGEIGATNAAFARLMSMGKSTVTGRALDVLSPVPGTEQRAIAQARLDEVLAGWSSVVPLDLAMGVKGELGRRVYLSPLGALRGANEAAVLYVIDTTEQKALEAKFAQSQKMEAVGNLAGGLAHNFNNVLTAIIGSADLMLQTHRATDPAHKDIQNIKTSANRAAALVAQLMAFSRQQTLSLEVLQLGEVMTDLRPMLKAQLQDKNDLKITTDRDLWYVTADRTQIDQVLLNLAGNASHAMPDGGTFTVRTRNVSEREAQKMSHTGFQVGEYVLIEAEDTGVGMSPEVLEKIFEPFFTTKEIGKGTGFGLATVYGIVKQLSGFIFPESTLGKGTIFKIYLPRAHVENEAEYLARRAAKKEIKTSDLTGSATVLVVEDEDMVRSVAVRSLTRLGYKVLEATNGLEALEIVAQNPTSIDIVVSDVVMPEMDGPSFLKNVRKTHPDLKIIFVSGHTNEAFKTTMDDHEAFAFLQKPFSLPQLAAKVKEELTR